MEPHAWEVGGRGWSSRRGREEARGCILSPARSFLSEASFAAQKVPTKSTGVCNLRMKVEEIQHGFCYYFQRSKRPTHVTVSSFICTSLMLRVSADTIRLLLAAATQPHRAHGSVWECVCVCVVGGVGRQIFFFKGSEMYKPAPANT